MWPLVLLGCIIILVVVLYVRKLLAPTMVGLPRVSMLKYRKKLPGIADHITEVALKGNHKLVVIDFPFSSAIMATHPDMARDVLKNNETIVKVAARKSIFSGLGKNSLIFADDEVARKQRLAMTPAFHFDFMTELMPIMMNKVEQLITKIPIGESFDVNPWMSKFTLDVLGLTVLGINFNTLEDKSSVYVHAYETLMAHGNAAFRTFIPMHWQEMLPLPYFNRVRDARDKILQMTIDIMENRKEKDKIYLIDMMLDAPTLTIDEVQANTLFLFVAGHETTAAALCWTLLLLGKHQDIQTRLRDEIERVLRGKHITAETMKELEYMDMFIKEVLRYGSPLGFSLNRITDGEVQLGDCLVPDKTKVGVNIHAIHHNPQFWPEPEVFNPDRFKPGTPIYPFSYLPFSLGKRTCMGNNFSVIEQKVFLSTILQRFTISNGKPVPFEYAPGFLFQDRKSVV